MKKINLSILSAVFPLLALGACSKKAPSPTGMTTAPVEVADEKKEKGKVSGKYSVGLDWCDDFLTKYEDCVMQKAPAVERPKLHADFQKTVEELTRATHESPQVLNDSCERNREAARKILAAYACQF